MSDTTVWVVIGAAGVLTFALRGSFIALIDVIRMPEPVREALRFVPAAVLSAIIAQAVFVQHGQIAIGPGSPRIIAALAAILVAWRTRSIFYTIAAGMLALWALKAAGFDG